VKISESAPPPPGSPAQNSSLKIKPRVLIMIAAGEISGPGKGVLQFLEHAPAGSFEYVLCNFDVKNRPAGQFVEEARRRGLNLRLLRQRLPFDPALITQALRVMREHDINVIQTHGYKSNTIGFFLQMLHRCPWIGFAHGYIDDNQKNRLYNRIDRLVLRRADRIVAVAGSMKALLVRHGVAAQKIRVVHNAIDPGEAVPGVSGEEIRRRNGFAPDQLVIGVIGRLNPEKGQMIFLQAMEKAARVVPGAKALIIGDGQDRPMLERFCLERGLSERVLFLGYQERIADYYQILDLLVLPSLSEGLPNTVLEAMSFGVPVLATAVGGVPEIIENGNGRMVPPNDPEALAAGMIELLGDGALRQAIGSKGKETVVARFAAGGRARQIVNLYEELLSDRAAVQMASQTEW
jgi:glycosyltransferase involved in cell wall biosynthesis